jgi:hypothetical protein
MGESRIPSAHNVRIIASCTQGKNRPVPLGLRLGTISQGSLAQRLVAWRERLGRQCGVDSVSAVKLYRGQHWAVVRELTGVARAVGYQADLWIASAGYGLIPAEAAIYPYSATFAASGEDSVARPSDGDRYTALRTWWKGLQTLPSPAAGAPRSLLALAGTLPTAILLVIGSPAYIAAMADDLAEARDQLVDAQRLIVISSRGGVLPRWLAPHVVPSVATLSSVLGGSRGSLHARTARRILEEAAVVTLRADVLVPRYEQFLKGLERETTPVRLKLSDERVRNFIRKALSVNRGLTCTAALRKLRMIGWACEQRRFAGIYAEVKREVHVS